MSVSAKKSKIKSKNNGTIGSHCLVFFIPQHDEEGTSFVVKTDTIPRTKRKVPLFQEGRFYVLPQQLALIASKTKRIEDWKSYVKAVIHELYGDSAAWISACGTRNTVGIHPQLFDDLYEEICKRTKIIVDKSDYIYQVNHLASNKRRPKKRKLESYENKEKATKAKNSPVCSDINNLSNNDNSTSILQNTSLIQPAFNSSTSQPFPILSQTPPTLSQPLLTLSTSSNKNFGSISSPNIQENQFSSYNQNDTQPLSHQSSFVPFPNSSESTSQIFDNPQFKNFITQCFMQITQQSTPPKYSSTVSHSSFSNNHEQSSFASSELNNLNVNYIEKDKKSYHIM